MATIDQVRRMAARTGCELKAEGNLITLYAPEGFTFEGEYEILGRFWDPGYLTKADIYDEFLGAMDDIRTIF